MRQITTLTGCSSIALPLEPDPCPQPFGDSASEIFATLVDFEKRCCMRSVRVNFLEVLEVGQQLDLAVAVENLVKGQTL